MTSNYFQECDKNTANQQVLDRAGRFRAVDLIPPTIDLTILHTAHFQPVCRMGIAFQTTPAMKKLLRVTGPCSRPPNRVEITVAQALTNRKHNLGTSFV